MSDGLAKYEYRVVWRREHDNRKRTKIYQTREGAEEFAAFIAEPVTDDHVSGWLFDHLVEIGDTTEVHIERRVVGEWAGSNP